MTADRKILLVVTDGEPHNGPATADVVTRCLASGYKACAISIGTKAPGRYFTSWARIDAIEELAPRMFGMLEPMLVVPISLPEPNRAERNSKSAPR